MPSNCVAQCQAPYKPLHIVLWQVPRTTSHHTSQANTSQVPSSSSSESNLQNPDGASIAPRIASTLLSHSSSCSQQRRSPIARLCLPNINTQFSSPKRAKKFLGSSWWISLFYIWFAAAFYCAQCQGVLSWLSSCCCDFMWILIVPICISNEGFGERAHSFVLEIKSYTKVNLPYPPFLVKET